MSAPSRKKTVSDIQMTNYEIISINVRYITAHLLILNGIFYTYFFIQFMLSGNPSHSDGFSHNHDNKHEFVYFIFKGVTGQKF